ncbi:MAG: trypsin-like peptidase domain-containing protein [Caldilineales bacterium]
MTIKRSIHRLTFVALLLSLTACLQPPGLVQISPATPTATPLAAAPAVVVVTATPPTGLDSLELRTIEVYRRYSPAVVNINTQVMRSDFFYGVYPEEGSGSGFVWDLNGHIITNYHVIEGADQITVSFDEGQAQEARVTGSDPANDLAVLQVSAVPAGVEPLPLGDSDALVVGQSAIAIGNPFGQFERTLTVGVVSAINRTIGLENGRTLRGVVQTDASINRGNSGGPLLDSRGRLIGVNSAIYSPTGADAGVGLAIPVNKLKQVVPVLIERGHFPHPWLGVEGLGYVLSVELAQVLQLPVQQGLLIARVYQNSPAEAIGIRTATQQVRFGSRRYLVGGDVLTAIDDTPLRTWDDLTLYLDEHSEVGQTVQLTIWRDGQSIRLAVILGEQPF